MESIDSAFTVAVVVFVGVLIVASIFYLTSGWTDGIIEGLILSIGAASIAGVLVLCCGLLAVLRGA